MLHISDIQTKEIFFFDEAYRKECFDFCNKRNIDFLPSLNKSNEIWHKVVDDFHSTIIAEKAKINGNTKAFDEKIVEAFRKNNLLFVYAGTELTGVLHFSDYNTHIVNVYLFGILSQYEKMLKEYLRKHGVTNETIIDFSGNSQYRREKFQEKINKSQDLQCLYLSDIINFTNDRKIGNIQLNHVDVIELRNMIMHAHELVNKKSFADDNLIFDFISFEIFFKHVLILNHDYLRLKNRMNFF